MLINSSIVMQLSSCQKNVVTFVSDTSGWIEQFQPKRALLSSVISALTVPFRDLIMCVHSNLSIYEDFLHILPRYYENEQLKQILLVIDSVWTQEDFKSKIVRIPRDFFMNF